MMYCVEISHERTRTKLSILLFPGFLKVQFYPSLPSIPIFSLNRCPIYPSILLTHRSPHLSCSFLVGLKRKGKVSLDDRAVMK